MNKEAIINDLYFNKKKSLTEIANSLNTSISYISKILRNNEKYAEEKELRKKLNMIKKKQRDKMLITENRKNKLFDSNLIYEQIKKEHNNAVRELSKKSNIGKEALRKWCPNAYIYNKKKKCYMFDTENILKPADFPLYIQTKL